MHTSRKVVEMEQLWTKCLSICWMYIFCSLLAFSVFIIIYYLYILKFYSYYCSSCVIINDTYNDSYKLECLGCLVVLIEFSNSINEKSVCTYIIVATSLKFPASTVNWELSMMTKKAPCQPATLPTAWDWALLCQHHAARSYQKWK